MSYTIAFADCSLDRLKLARSQATATTNTIGGPSTGARNLLSGNTGRGVLIDGLGTSGNLVLGNFIGTDATGTLTLGNGASGVRVEDFASGNTIGGLNSTFMRHRVSCLYYFERRGLRSSLKLIAYIVRPCWTIVSAWLKSFMVSSIEAPRIMAAASMVA